MKTTKEQRGAIRDGLIAMWGDRDGDRARQCVPSIEGANTSHTAFDLLDDIDEVEREREKLVCDVRLLEEHGRRSDRYAEKTDKYIAELEAERNAIARARDCGAEPHDPCALPPGNTCDAHTIATLHRDLAVAQERTRWGALAWGIGGRSVMSPGRKKLHLMIDEAEAREEDARRELEKTRKEIRAMQVQQHIDAGRVRVTKAPSYANLLRGFSSFPAIGLSVAEVAEIRDRVAAAGGSLPVVISGEVVGEVRTVPGGIAWNGGPWPSANLQIPDLVDALPEYQLAPVDREAPARVLAVLTRKDI